MLVRNTVVLIILFLSIPSQQKIRVNPNNMNGEYRNLDLTCGFTDDFTSFIEKNNYKIWGFDRPDLKCASFGGKASSSEQIKKIPVIFVHGNSDIGFGRGTIDGYGSWQTGFRSLATYLGSQGYTKSELYTTTWGDANIDKASQKYHSKIFVLTLRAFVEAVLTYTQAPHVNIVSHSMGVTLIRKAVQGGIAEDSKEGKYDVGVSLKTKVKSFIGIAGGNLGLTACFNSQYLLPTCSVIDGFDPGQIPTAGPSRYLKDLNKNAAGEGMNVYAVWSKYDDVIGGECVVWGKVTCKIPGQKDQIVKRTVEWGHLALRDKIGPDIIGLLQ